MEVALRSSTNSSDSVNVVTTLPSGGLEGMMGSRLAMRTRCFEERLRQQQRLAMGGLLLIHKRSTGIRAAMLPCLANASRTLPRLHGGAAQHGWHAHAGPRHAAERAKIARSGGAVWVFVLSCLCCS